MIIDHKFLVMISRIRSHSCLVTLSQTNIQLNYQFINASNLTFGSTWACICEIELHMASIGEDVLVSSLYTFMQDLSVTQINA